MTLIITSRSVFLVSLLIIAMAVLFYLPLGEEKIATPEPSPSASGADKSCRPTGCSGQICADDEIITTCEFKSEYECYKNTKCERQSDGNCGWTLSYELEACLKKDLIKVTKPQPNEIIDPQKDFAIEGEARGNWYFEATFTVRLRDSEDNELYLGFIQADGEWTTPDFVPFHKTFKFDPPATDSGILILEKANPSGLPEHDDKLVIPVKFGRP